MKSGNFEVGDKVRVARPDPHDGGDSFIGKTGVVEGPWGSGDEYEWSVHLDGATYGGEPFTTEELELVVEPARKFAVGDKVKIVKDTSGCRKDTVGKIGVIDGRMDRADKYVWSVDCEDGDWVPCCDDQLELIAPADSTTPATLPTVEGVAPVAAVKVGATTFSRDGDVIVVMHRSDDDAFYVDVMTLAQFNEVHRIINEEGNA